MRGLIISLVLASAASAQAADDYLVNWEDVGEESLTHLVELIRIDSSNPPGNETEVAHYLREVLAADGLESQLYALEPDRANLVVRRKGDGSKRPLLIMGHTDVVGVEPDQWSEPPFAGTRKDGYVWGRGSLDDKDNVAAGLMVMLLLERFDVTLARDVIFLAAAGEEGTPDVGINFMVDKHWDVIDSEYCLAEGGDATIENGQVRTVGIQTTEKMPRRATLVARGTPGHGSRPVMDNAVHIIATAVARAGEWTTPMRLNETTQAYFERLAAISEGDEAFRYRNVGNPEHTESIQTWFHANRPYLYSILRTSVAPTVIEAGFRRNVIPAKASAILDIRMLPDEDVPGFYEKLANVIDDPRVEIVPERIYRPAAPPSPIDNEMFRTLETVSREIYGDATVLPTMAAGATDMAQVRAKGVHAYGIGPARTIEEINSGHGAHGVDERITESAYVDMLRFLWRATLEIAATD